MNQSPYLKNQDILSELIAQAGIKDREELSKKAKVSGLQIKRLEYGLVYKLSVENLLKLATILNLSPEILIAKFSDNHLDNEETSQTSTEANANSNQNWQQEYKRLEIELKHQADNLEREFQQKSIDTIESWLIQWPTAIAAIDKNPDLPAARLIPLVKPVKELVEKWGLTPISEVGQELGYDPQWHELMTGEAEPGAMVKIRYVGYQQKDRILYKAKVSPLNTEQ